MTSLCSICTKLPLASFVSVSSTLWLKSSKNIEAKSPLPARKWATPLLEYIVAHRDSADHVREAVREGEMLVLNNRRLRGNRAGQDHERGDESYCRRSSMPQVGTRCPRSRDSGAADRKDG